MENRRKTRDVLKRIAAGSILWAVLLAGYFLAIPLLTAGNLLPTEILPEKIGEAPLTVKAAGETTNFGSESYSWELGTENPIGIYVNSDSPIYYVDLVVTYDPQMLQYSSGGELESEGTVRISAGGGMETEFSMMLNFIPLMSGSTQISISNTTVQYESGETSIATDSRVGVQIPVTEGNALSGLTVNGQAVPGFAAGTMSYSMDVAADIQQAAVQATAQSADTTVEISDTALKTGANTITILTTSSSGERARYLLTVNRPEQTAGSAGTEDGTSGNPDSPDSAQTDPEPSVQIINEKEDEGIGAGTILAIAAGILLLLLALLIALEVRISRRKRRRRKRRAHTGQTGGEKAGGQQNLSTPIAQKGEQNQTVQKEGSQSGPEEDKNEKSVAVVSKVDDDTRETEIDVQHVTMTFKREKDEATSIKELMIRTIKRQRSYEMFKALDDVSFTVKKGEVVGIIGTNGSGKSTILKIISGVLTPTKGRVLVDKSKIQLLTLGTGFDFELTGRENVYLNGAIIGYTKEFIDEKYDDIVKFAELEGFMEEKVRNYSSGMVSRLGFAIATIRDTPEILILDEVLSVGDMFFQKKSSARIKEMMHGGSTVLIVSHSTSVIKSNCTKAVWIEKGKLRAVGEPQEVCAAYEKMNQGA